MLLLVFACPMDPAGESRKIDGEDHHANAERIKGLKRRLYDLYVNYRGVYESAS